MSPVPPRLAETVIRHLVDATTALCTGWSISSYMGVELLDDQGRSSMVTAIDDIADVRAFSNQAAREWLALEKFGFREVRHRPNTAVEAAVSLTVGVRRNGDETTLLQPTHEMLGDPETEWALFVTGVTRDFGITVAIPWGSRIGVKHRLREARIAPLAFPYDVLDGVLALPLPQENAR
jgi:hypothetical protein